ncbi:MAG: YbaN family protein [Spirochaetales bacterium]
MRIVIYRALGILFTGIGIVGIFVPLLPTTDLLLIALWFFARSSRRLENWLLHHRIFGKYVYDLWVRGGMTRQAKKRAVIAMSSVLLLSAVVMPFFLKKLPVWIFELILAGVWGIATTYILSRKTLDELTEAERLEKIASKNP